MKQKKTIAIVFLSSLGILLSLSNCGGGETAKKNSTIQKEATLKHDEAQAQQNEAPKIAQTSNSDNTTIVGKWQGVNDVIYNNEQIPKYEERKKAFKQQNPFLTEAELHNATQKEIDRITKIVAIETQRTQNYRIEFTADGKYKFNNKNTGEQSTGDWKIKTEHSDSYLFLKDAKTNKIYDYRMERDEQGYCGMRMPVAAKGKQNTNMRKIE